MDFKRVKIFTTVPKKHAAKVRKALGEAGAGQIGEYSFCSFTISGTGRFKPSGKATPYIGKAGQLEEVEEEKIEVECSREDAKKVISALKGAHPYEEVIVDIVPLIDEAML